MNYESFVKPFFEGLGYQVEKIAESDIETPDFSIFDDISSYVLELKTKFPTEAEIVERMQLLEVGKIHQLHETIISKNRLSGIIKKAKDQLESHNKKDLCIVWLLATGHLAEPRMLQFEATLYGLSPLVSAKRTGDCFFFYNSDFFRYRGVLDAAIVSTESEAKLLLNPLSPRYKQMKNSSLPKHLGEAVIDPVELEKNGKAFYMDSDVDRGDKEAVLAYLRDKYKSDDIASLTMTYLSGTIAIQSSTE
jgi:hypothetical protein